MFKKIVEKLKELSRNKSEIDPAVFSDPIAEQTSWDLASKGAANFQIHKMRQIFDDRIEFIPTLGLKLFCAVFVLAGLGAIALMVFVVAARSDDAHPLLVGIPFGSAFIAAGLAMYFHTASPIVFDKHAGFFWKGRKRPHEVFDTSVIKHFARLNEIHALQLLKFWNSGGEGASYRYYELNLVLKDGNRINVVNYVKDRRIREDAARLSEFLGVPIWDAIDQA